MHGYYDGAIIVNSDGKRFVNESLSYKLLADAALAQKDPNNFQLFDEPLRVAMRDKSAKYKKLLSPMDNGGETDYCLRGDTLEEAAKKAGIPPEALTATVERYNQAVDSGKDTEFGRTSLTSGFGKLVKIEKGPFYLYRSRGRIIATYCGLRIDPKGEVVDVFGEPIRGLWACGEVCGGVHGAAYMTGTAVCKAMAYGRIAALKSQERSPDRISNRAAYGLPFFFVLRIGGARTTFPQWERSVTALAPLPMTVRFL